MSTVFISIIFPTLTTLISGIILWWFINKPKLYVYFQNAGHVTMFPDENKQHVPMSFSTHSISIANGGKSSLKLIQVLHQLDVSHDKADGEGNKNNIGLNIFPEIPYKFSGDGKILEINSLAPHESITIMYLYPSKTQHSFCTIHKFFSPLLPLVRADEAVGRLGQLVRTTLNVSKNSKTFFLVFAAIGFWVVMLYFGALIVLLTEKIIAYLCG